MTYPLIGSSWQPVGWPDRLFVHGKLRLSSAYVEFKMQGEQLEPHQARIQRDLRERGCDAYTAYFTGNGQHVGIEGQEWVTYRLFMKQLIDATHVY